MSTSVTGLRRQVILRQIQRCSQEYGPRSPATRLWQDELQRFDNDQNKERRRNKCFICFSLLIPRALDQFRSQAKIPVFSIIYWDLIGSDQPPLV